MFYINPELNLEMTQEDAEFTFSKKNRMSIIQEELLQAEFFLEDLKTAVLMVAELPLPEGIEQFNKYDFVLNLLTITTEQVQPIPLVSIAVMVAEYCLSNDCNNVLYVITVLNKLSELGLYSLEKRHTWLIKSELVLDDSTHDKLNVLMVQPPMIESPKFLKKNTDSVYYTVNKDSVILGSKHNQHNERVSLDVLNIQNSIKFSLDFEFLESHEEMQSEGSNLTPYQWEDHLIEAELTYKFIKDNGNTFYIPNKYDARSRMYAVGYHVNPQGSPFHKAMLEFAEKEIVELT